ncbi:MAG: MBL fold metallo-hydrolase [Usitatibacter sp.]
MNKLLAVIATAFCAVAFAQDFSKVEIKTTKLSDTVYFLAGAGGNIAVSAGADSVFVVDDQFAPLAPKITAAIAAISPKPIQFIFNTHWHGDHVGGNEAMGKAGAIIVAHENVRRRMSTDQFMAFMKTNVPASPKVALPIVTFNGSINFHLNGEDIRIVHAPQAHTDGDAMVYFAGSDILHMGDVYFNGFYPFIDAGSGGTIEGTIAACDMALGMVTDKSKIIPGHGPVSTRAELVAYRDMLRTIMGRVRSAINEGKSDEQIAAADLSKDLDEKWGKGFLKPAEFAGMVAAMMRRKP